MAATTLGPNVKLGVIPFTVQWPVFLDHSFWIVDNGYVIVETKAAELRLTRPEEVQIYAKVFDQLAAIASYGAAARALITRVLLERSSESEKDSGSD